MKKLFGLLAACLLAVSAQASDLGIGVNVGYATKSGLSTGFIGAKALIGLPLNLALAPSMNYWFPKTESLYKLKFWDANVDMHFNLLNLGLLKVYPLIGLNYTYVKMLDDQGYEIGPDLKGGQVGANLGAGAQVRFLPTIGASIEAKGLLSDGFTQFIPTATLYFLF